MTLTDPIAHVGIVYAEQGACIYINGTPHTPNDLAILREVYDRSQTHLRLTRAVNAPGGARSAEALAARFNWANLVALLDAASLAPTTPAIAVGRELARLQAELQMEVGASERLRDVLSAAAALADSPESAEAAAAVVAAVRAVREACK